MKGVVVALAGLLATACASDGPAPRTDRKLVIFGVDGMDPKLLREYMAAGKMPHLEGLAARGGFVELGTTEPPQSPVAWSTFITGHGWDGHGIFDFVHRDARTLEPYLSTSRVDPPDRVLEIGSLALPIGSASMELLREGRPWWEDLADAGIPSTVVKIPANFPPSKARGHHRSLSGMGTPDLLGSPGTFQLYTDDPALAEKAMSGGLVHPLTFSEQRARATLVGPYDPLAAEPRAMTLPVEVLVDARRPVAMITVGDERVILQPKEWSPWLTVTFDEGILPRESSGIVRLYLAHLEPHVKLYASPINLDPRAPANPVSHPEGYAAELAAAIGPFYTQGMPLDTKALAGGALTDAELLSQAENAWQERLALLDYEIDRYEGGLLFFYFSLVDQLSHVFWRTLEPDATPEEQEFAYVIPDIYQRVDTAIGAAIEKLGPDVDILVLSDHGFSSYRRKVNLNTWLANRGYLEVLDAASVGTGTLGHIDWSQTQAYALGLNQLFLNLRGREKNGVVDPARRGLILDRLERDLLSWRDPETGGRVVTRVTRPEAAAFDDRVPDVIVGYNRGYRSSDGSAMGEIGETELADNESVWSGDHCMDPSHVPGVLLSNRPIASGGSLADVAPTVLSYFGVAPGEPLPGKSLLTE